MMVMRQAPQFEGTMTGQGRTLSSIAMPVTRPRSHHRRWWHSAASPSGNQRHAVHGRPLRRSARLSLFRTVSHELI